MSGEISSEDVGAGRKPKAMTYKSVDDSYPWMIQSDGWISGVNSGECASVSDRGSKGASAPCKEAAKENRGKERLDHVWVGESPRPSAPRVVGY